VFRTSHLTKHYGQVAALEDLSVEVPSGRIGLVGANGAGKTTLFRLLLGLSRPTAGVVEIDGRRVDADPVGIRARIGYMPEHDCLPSDQSAADLVAGMGELTGLPAREARQRASDVLNLVGLDEARFRPMGTFSTGMKQRVKLAQALAGDPRLLLLDEPTNGLDPAGRNAMLELIGRIGEEFGIPIVVASHLLGEIERICDGLVAIEAGRLLRADTMDNFTRASQTLLIEVEDGTAALHRELARRGVRVQPFQRALLVPIADDRTYDVVRDSVAALGVPLSRLEQRRHQVEEIFRDDQQDYQVSYQAREAADAY